MRKKTIFYGVFLAVLFSSLLFVRIALADDGLNASIPWETGGIGTHFELNNNPFGNVKVDSSESVSLNLLAFSDAVTISFDASDSVTSTQITVGGLLPSASYFVSKDSYDNQTAITTDGNGNLSFAQEIGSNPHIVFIQRTHSTTHIRDDSTGGDCTTVGSWNSSTKTCTLTTDISGTVEIDNNNLALDGNGHKINISGGTYGIYIWNLTGVTVRNTTIAGSNYNQIGVFASHSQYINFSNNNASGLVEGFFMQYVSSSTIQNNIASNNSGIGIALDYAGNFNDVVSNNTASNNGGFGGNAGIELQASSTTVTGNTVKFNSSGSINNGGFGILLKGPNNIITNNDLEENLTMDLMPSGDSSSDCKNTVQGNIGSGGAPIQFYNSATSTTLTTVSELILCKASGSYISGGIVASSATLKNNGIILEGTNNSILENMVSSDNYIGLELIDSSQNTIRKSESDRNALFGVYIASYYGAASGNIFYQNNFIANSRTPNVTTGNIFYLALPTGGNHWSEFATPGQGCVDANNDGICDSAFASVGDNFPWVARSGWDEPTAHIASLQQYKSDVTLPISEGSTTTENTVAFGAQLGSLNPFPIQLQVEVEPSGAAFANQPSATSTFVTPGASTTVIVANLSDGQYHWQARAVDSLGNQSL